MTRYEELAATAVQAAELSFKDKRRCEDLARRLCGALRSFLEGPAEAIQLVDLDPELQPVGEPHPKIVNLTMGADQRWYFGLHFHFGSESSKAFQYVTLEVGVQTNGSKFRVYFERAFDIDKESSDSFNEFAEYVHAYLKEDFDKPVYSPRQHIGFSR